MAIGLRWSLGPALAAVALVAHGGGRSALGGDDDRRRPDPVRLGQTIATSKDPVARFEAVQALGRAGGERSVEILADVVREDADFGLRLEAAETLGVIGGAAAVRTAVDLVGEAGPRELRDILARVLVRLEVPPDLIAAEVDSPRRSGPARVHLTEALAWNEDPIAAAHLERLARIRRTPVGEAAIRALERHPLGPKVLPDLLLDVLSTAEDVDSIVTALDAAERHCDARIRDVAPVLAARSNRVIDSALEVAAAHVSERLAAGAGRPVSGRARIRDRVDRAFVFHLGRDTARVWAEARNLLTDSRPRWEDVRVSCIGYLEPTPSRPRRVIRELPFTRDPNRVDEFFLAQIVQFKRGTGQGLTTALDHAYARSGWRWGADRRVVLFADAAPPDLKRALVAPALHLSADGTALSVFYFARLGADVPRGIEDIAAAGRTVPQVLNAVAQGNVGTGPHDGGGTGKPERARR